MARLSNFRRTKKDVIKEFTLLGDLFITIDNGNIVDMTGNNRLIIDKVGVNYASIESLYFDGTNSNIKILDTGIFSFSLEDFTIDWWEHKLTPPKYLIDKTQCSLCKHTKSDKYPFLINDFSGQCIYLSSDGKEYDLAYRKYIGDIKYDTWTHWALVRCNNNFYTFRNGGIKNIWKAIKPIYSSMGALTIGSDTKNNNFYGYMNNIRVVKGQALWIEEFEPSDEELYY